LDSGEIFGISGHSGSGKSTLLRLLCRLEEPTEGEIDFEGKTQSSIPPQELRRKVTLVFQTPVLMGNTVAEDLVLGLGLSQPSSKPAIRDEEWGKETLRKVHLSPAFLSENPKKLSVGEAQRVALARAMAIKPRVLLLDEPTSALDLSSKQAIEATLKEAAASGMSIILVSHDPRQIQELAPRGLELSRGEMLRKW